MELKLLLVAALCIATAQAHICLLHPIQRGGANISEAGSRDCVHPDAPCGPSPIETPFLTLEGGQSLDVLFQQNLNHYNPGHPGFLEVAWSEGFNQTSDDDFTRLAVVNDFWSHLQASQTNFSVPVLVPDIDCEHCVLQVRYHPNKPTEPIFHNCADIRIKKRAPSKNFGQVLALVQPTDTTAVAETSLVMDSDTNEIHPVINSHDFQNYDFFPADGLVGADTVSQTVYLIGASPKTLTDGEPANRLFSYHANSDKPNGIVDLVGRPANTQWTSIVSTGDDTQPIMLVGLKQLNETSFAYTLHSVDVITGETKQLLQAAPDSEFVNFLWADIDYSRRKVYVLAGDENSLYELGAVIYTFDLTAMKVSVVTADVSQYTYSSFHVDRTGALVALSPGLYISAHSWSLLTIDPATGAASLRAQVAPAGLFDVYYGGSFYGASLANDGSLLQVMKRLVDDSVVLLHVNTENGKIISGNSINLGVNNEFSIKSPIYLPPM